MALTSFQKCLFGQSKSHQEPQEPGCLGLNPYVQWVPVKYYFVTRMEQSSLDMTWAGLGVRASDGEGVM